MPGYNQDVDPHADYNTAARNWKQILKKKCTQLFILLITRALYFQAGIIYAAKIHTCWLHIYMLQ